MRPKQPLLSLPPLFSALFRPADRRLPLRTAGPALALCVLLGAGRAAALDVSARVVNGVTTAAHPAVGVLLNSASFASADLLCTGTMIGCRSFLTAAHCVEGSVNPASYGVFLQHAGFFAVSAVQIHPSYSFPDGDVAVLTLAAPQSGIPPARLNASNNPPFGTAATIVGFGRTGGTAEDYGVKREGDVTTVSCPAPYSNTNSVCWEFDNPVGPPGADSNTCNGDSGGPLFADLGDGAVQIGITSGGDSLDCFPSDTSFDANVFNYYGWIAGLTGSDIDSTMCGAVTQVGQPGTFVYPATGSLDPMNTEATHVFTLGSGYTSLRVTMNGATDPAGNDFDLYVKQGSAPTTMDFDCKDDGGGQFANCSFANPVAGDWYVLVKAFNVATSGGLFQITATAYSVAPDGTPCDDGNSCTGPDTIQSGMCTGTPVADSTPCSDGSYCTVGDACVAGTCVAGTSPQTGCKLPFSAGRGSLLLKDQINNAKDKLIWKWTSGSQTDPAELGDPVSGGTVYALCIYDESGATPQLVMENAILPGSWEPSGFGFKYRDASRSSDGIGTAVLTPGADGEAKIIVRGKTAQLSMTALPLQQDGKVTVRLVNTNGACWQADYSTNLSNTAELFKAKAD